jgi:D-glycero-D-manno-heptose 1,7-bisphosphate phosphatase
VNIVPARALFLDRDGVINVDHAYVHRREDFEFIDGVFDLVRRARTASHRVFVVTNQAGIARGYYTEEDFHRLTAWMQSVFAAQGAPIDKVYYCPYHAEHGIGRYKLDSPLRKPQPGMILQAADEFGIDLSRSLLVGDMITDIEAGQAAGVGRNLLFRPGEPPGPGRIARLIDAADYF